jgi:ABC-type transport system involved in cytochrome bd biosynthesis fused ATPase/permease subunit
MQLREALIVLFLVPEAYAPLRQMGAQFHAVADGMGAADRMFEILETPAPLISGIAKPEFDSKFNISVRDASFTYPNAQLPALLPISVEFESGKLTAIKGTSGSGKSTLVNLLMCFALPTTGKILANDQDLASIDPDFWRSSISYFPQTPWLPYGTIRNALLMGRPEATDFELIATLTKVGIEITNSDDFPIGLATEISTTSGLSMGQRRRIALARAILQDRPIFILDEPTASLDSVTEQIVLETLRQLTSQNKCVIAVAHRPHLVINADQVIEIHEPEFAGVNQ